MRNNLLVIHCFEVKELLLRSIF